MKEEEFLKLTYTELEKKTGTRRGTWSKYFSTDSPETTSWQSLERIANSLAMSPEQVIKAIKLKRLAKKNFVSNPKQKKF